MCILILLFSYLRLSKHGLEKLRAEHGGVSEIYKGFSLAYWAFSKQPIIQSLSKLPEVDEQIALQIFQIILTYSGLGQNGKTRDTIFSCNLFFFF